MIYYNLNGSEKKLKANDIFMMTAGAEDIEINKNELAQRLGVSRGYSDDMIEKCRKRLMGLLSYKCAYINVPVSFRQENICDLEFMQVRSRNLYRNLRGCSRAFVLGVTAGMAVDRELARLRVISEAEYFITDALASAAVDSFCEYACREMSRGMDCARRFSPGYGDLELSCQTELLERINGQGLLGITLTSSYLMVPMKSITAIMGIRQ